MSPKPSACSELLLKQKQTGYAVLKNCRNELYRIFPFLDGAFTAVSCLSSKETEKIGTDGNIFYFSPLFVLHTYAQNPVLMRRGYVHMLLHCLYLHILPSEKYDRSLWNLACDIAVECIIEKEGRPELYQKHLIRQNCFREMDSKTLSAEQIYFLLEQGRFSGTIQELKTAFSFDDHSFWDKNISSEKISGLRRKWKKVLSYTSRNQQGHSPNAGSSKGDTEEKFSGFSKNQYDYRHFLKRFALLREEPVLDTESFDYIPYTYGMDMYGNLPFVEPLEYKEGNRLEELVIAIDTSGSCSTEIVQQFLSETGSIFEEKENFFRKMNVCLIQCDCCIQDVAVIHSHEEWTEYAKKIRIHGRAGTDFRPVFRYISKLRQNKLLKNLKALIYFTDGDGIFPPKKTDYETAFVFLKKPKAGLYIPPWIRCLTTDSKILQIK